MWLQICPQNHATQWVSTQVRMGPYPGSSHLVAEQHRTCPQNLALLTHRSVIITRVAVWFHWDFELKGSHHDSAVPLGKLGSLWSCDAYSPVRTMLQPNPIHMCKYTLNMPCRCLPWSLRPPQPRSSSSIISCWNISLLSVFCKYYFTKAFLPVLVCCWKPYSVGFMCPECLHLT